MNKRKFLAALAAVAASPLLLVRRRQPDKARLASRGDYRGEYNPAAVYHPGDIVLCGRHHLHKEGSVRHEWLEGTVWVHGGRGPCLNCEPKVVGDRGDWVLIAVADSRHTLGRA